MSTKVKKCAVVGSGVAGIAAAIRLAQQGHSVVVFEKNTEPGGKLTEEIIGPYRFDFGPSLFTLPENITDLFSICGKNINDYFSYELVNPSHRYFYEDGTVFTAYHPIEKFAEEAERVFQEPKGSVLEYLKEAREKYMLTKDMFLSKSLHKVSNYFSIASMRSMLQFYKLDTFITLNQLHEKKFKSEKLIQFFNRFATYNGSSPYKAPGTLGLIPHLEVEKGVFYPKGGMHAITKALVRLAEDMGVEFKLNHTVNEIVVENLILKGIRVNDVFQPYDLVVSNMDVYYTYSKLLPSIHRPEKTLSQEKSYAAVVFYWGVKKEFPQLLLHNLVWSDSYEEEFSWLVDKKEIYRDPTLYINITSKLTKSDAPKGAENWFLMVNAPYNAGQDWDLLVKDLRKNVVAKINRIFSVSIEEYIEVEKVLTPVIMETKTMSAFGALYGNSSNSKFASFLRHPNFHSKIKGLYFCGGTVHPGGGIPLCLMSAKIVADLVEQDS